MENPKQKFKNPLSDSDMENNEEQRFIKLSFPTSLPITINAISYATLLPITITADSITTTGQWSPLFPNLDPSTDPTFLSLSLPTRLNFPTTITIATTTFTATATVSTDRTLFNLFVDNEPRSHQRPPLPPHSHGGYHQHLTTTHSITIFPITIILILEHNDSDNKPVGVPITIFDNLVTIEGHPLYVTDAAHINPSLAAILLMPNANVFANTSREED
ncbi:unnamed protein product [Lupinus luteus]|uniref:Uncharacterized protein n=1 Tax=Lupinus luteus TaxID=3873 RepID=A0AAV1XG93_LUPLU